MERLQPATGVHRNSEQEFRAKAEAKRKLIEKHLMSLQNTASKGAGRRLLTLISSLHTKLGNELENSELPE